MTNEELEKEFKSVSEEMDKLSNQEEPLAKKEKRRKYILTLQKETLLKIRSARGKDDKNAEFQNIAMYGMLATFGDRHPIWLHLARGKIGLQL